MRKAGDVVFTDVDRHGDGIVEFSNREDMERAVDKLDDEEFKGRDGSSYIRVKFANKNSDRSKSRSRSRSRDKKRRDDDSDGGDRKGSLFIYILLSIKIRSYNNSLFSFVLYMY